MAIVGIGITVVPVAEPEIIGISEIAILTMVLVLVVLVKVVIVVTY